MSLPSFTMPRESFAAAMQSLGRVTKKNTLPAISRSVYVETANGFVTFRATNLTSFAEMTYPASTNKEGAAIVSIDPLIALSSGGNGTVTLSPDKTRLRMQTNEGEHRMNALDPDEFPVMQQAEVTPLFSINSDLFAATIRKVSYAASKDEARPILTGVSIVGANNKITFSAADGFRLATATLDVPIERDFTILPSAVLLAEALAVLPKAAIVEVGLADMRLVVTSGDSLIMVNTIPGNAPDFARLIPVSPPVMATVDSAALLRAIDRIRVIDADGNKSRYTIESGQMVIYATSQKGDATFSVACEGKEGWSIWLNDEYLRQALRGVEGSQIKICNPSEEGSPLVITDGNSIHVVMPMYEGGR